MQNKNKKFNEIFKGYEERSGTKLDVAYRSLDSLRAKFAEIRMTSMRTVPVYQLGNNGEPDNDLTSFSTPLRRGE